MKFFMFRQNNSGGYFKVDEKVNKFVIIRAENIDHANEIAKKIGIYFDGKRLGYDCPCCGDRWNRAYEEMTNFEMLEYIEMLFGEFQKPITDFYFYDEFGVKFEGNAKARLATNL